MVGIIILKTKSSAKDFVHLISLYSTITYLCLESSLRMEGYKPGLSEINSQSRM